MADVGLRLPLRGPFERWPHATDLCIALLAFVLTLALWSSRTDVEGLNLNTLAGVGTWLCAFIGSFALLWRRSHPLQVHGLVLALSLIIFFGPLSNGLFAMAFTLYSVGRYEPSARASLAGLAAGLIYIAIDSRVFTSPGVEDVLAGALAFLLWYTGRRLRFRGEYLRLLEERAQHLERERSLEAERAVAAERTRIAREMHDVVAHQVSLMTVQAGAARTITSSDPAAAGDAMAAVETAGRHALSEMRQLLGVLRPADTHDGLAPQPGVDDLPALVKQVSDVGPRVAFERRGDWSAVPASIELAVYRIVQETLTNVIKHAGEDVDVD
ncbi:MAG: histidine kinase, partial [Pseudomonadota bacterium]